MINFKNNTIEDEINQKKKTTFYGVLLYENYPVNLKYINEGYFIDTLIQSFQPFLQIQKPIDQDPNVADFKLERSDFYGRDTFDLEFYIKKPSLKNSDITNFINTIEIRLTTRTDDDDVYIEYWTERIFRYASRKRYREEIEDETFLQNVLNAMARLLNTIIKDYSMMSSSVLRTKTGKFLGPAETLVAQYIGADKSIVKDGQKKLQGGRSRTKKYKKRGKKSNTKK
jgi:hypothetical protein